MNTSSVFVIVLSLFAAIAFATDAPLTVRIVGLGKVTGFNPNANTRAFLGIPYATPPLGSLRFTAPVEVDPWRPAILNATQYQLACVQIGVSASLMSEDCLYLNVFTPRAANPNHLPVLVWFHGGRYWQGLTNQYSGNYLPDFSQVILVTVTYRLNVFGFFANEDLVSSDDVNVGLLDQRHALAWVNHHIAAFGGDADRITIFGESAGAGSVMNHLFMTRGRRLFDSAILQSTWQWRLPNLTQALTGARNWAATLNCTGTSSQILACMRALPALSILPSLGNSHFFTPVVDGDLIPNQPLALFRDGKFNKRVRIVLGRNQNEGYYMAYTRSGFQPPSGTVSDTTYTNAITAAMAPYFSSADISAALSYYNSTKVALGNWYGLADFMGDYYIDCGSYLAAVYIAQKSRQPFYTYVFNYTSANYPQQFLYAAHGNELDFIFNATVYTPYTFTATDIAIAARMMAAWGSIGYEVDPPASGWPQYTTVAQNAFLWDQPATGGTPAFSKARCSFWAPYFTP